MVIAGHRVTAGGIESEPLDGARSPIQQAVVLLEEAFAGVPRIVTPFAGLIIAANENAPNVRCIQDA